MGVNFPHSIDNVETEGQQRVPISLQGRYMLLRSNEEYQCSVCEMSAREASLIAPVASMPGEKVVLYLNQLGRLTGVILRATEKGFEMSLELTQRKRDKLAEQLTWYANRATMNADDKRKHDRIVPMTDITVLRLPQGGEHVVRIRDLSLSGVSVETDRFVPLGAEVMVGNTPARVVRVQDDTVACEFLRRFEPGEIDETTRL